MQFLIQCVSGDRTWGPPCDKAIESDDIYHTYSLPHRHPKITEEFINNLELNVKIPGLKFTKEEWLSKSRNQRFEDGYWRYNVHGYTVEIEDLDALLALQSQVGFPIIINYENPLDNIPSIMIYDDYIE
jgi:hypothetical protein